MATTMRCQTVMSPFCRAALIAEVDGRPTGLAHYLFHRHCWRIENVCYLQDLFVAPEARGRGVGTALIDALCREAARRGYQAIRLEVIDANPRARALYEREGFIATRTDRLGLLRFAFGFDSATTMIRVLS